MLRNFISAFKHIVPYFFNLFLSNQMCGNNFYFLLVFHLILGLRSTFLYFLVYLQ